MCRFVSASDKEVEMNVRYRIELSQAERDALTTMLSGGKHAARKLKRAQILLAADAGSSDDEIARTVAVVGSTVYRTKRRFVEGNLERALSEEQRPGAERKLTGREEALLVATACASPPEGRARWTLELLADAVVKVTERRAAEDYAQCMRELVDVHYPHAEYIRVVQDNLSTHSAGALYEAFPPAEARRILRRLEFHYTPKHASWLNMVEIEIGVLRGQCLDRRIDDPKRLRREITAWERQRNAARSRIKWMFTTDKARAKMAGAYPATSKES